MAFLWKKLIACFIRVQMSQMQEAAQGPMRNAKSSCGISDGEPVPCILVPTSGPHVTLCEEISIKTDLGTPVPLIIWLFQEMCPLDSLRILQKLKNTLQAEEKQWFGSKHPPSPPLSHSHTAPHRRLACVCMDRPIVVLVLFLPESCP